MAALGKLPRSACGRCECRLLAVRRKRTVPAAAGKTSWRNGGKAKVRCVCEHHAFGLAKRTFQTGRKLNVQTMSKKVPDGWHK